MFAGGRMDMAFAVADGAAEIADHDGAELFTDDAIDA